MASKRTILLDGKQVAIRSYEVSIWTLQDSFITVLKWSNLENKGQIQKPKVILDNDGTENFSFSIPMYLHPGEENPIWYNTSNGNLMIGMRKIKVILNKTLNKEKVFEFLITKVKERHEKDQLYCDVECEGLAFHELGKVGYKLALSQDDFINDYEEWMVTGVGDEPRETIDYWNTKIGLPYATNNQIPNKWYYKVEMSWGSADSNLNKFGNKVYENSYVSSWELNGGNVLVPSHVENAREKYHSVEISESNIYNITQKIAESFGVFCRYEYGYDANYHIISRTVVYYNNFIEEEQGHMDLTYPYHTSEITREMDSTELTTKLFVRPVDYEYSETGETTIMSVDANKSREDYILNFDYLHKFNIITDEQYVAVEEYEALMHSYNIDLEKISSKLNYLQNREIELKAKNTTLINGSKEADTQINDAADHISNLLNDQTGTIEINASTAKNIIVKKDSENNYYYITMPFVGIIPESLEIYRTRSYVDGQPTLSDKITSGTIIFDTKTGDIEKVINLPIIEPMYKSVWMTCQYVPYTYWTQIVEYWQKAKENIDEEQSNIEAQLTAIEELIEDTKEIQQQKLDEQAEKRKEFEQMMGPALREGYWQPDDFNDYNNRYFCTFSATGGEEGKASYVWDTTIYDNDNKIIYYEGQNLKTYLYADLNSLTNEQLNYIKNNYDNLGFIYHDEAIIALNQSISETNPSESQQIAYIRDTKKNIRVGAGCRFSFIKVNDDIHPALVIEDSKRMTDDQITFLINNNSGDYVSVLGVLNTQITTNNNTSSSIASGAISLVVSNSPVIEVYPRIIIDSLLLKHTTQEDLFIKFNNEILQEYYDYSVIIDSYVDNNEEIWKDEYFINLKPETYFKLGILSPSVSINYSLSNANTMIYLDALEVSKENAYPKVSYTIKLSLYDPYIIHEIYNKMSHIVHINDNQLKFENVQGYISHIEMLLDTPWEDSIEVKNYKTKFEDLFSNIVAQTDAMSKKSFGYDVAAAAFSKDGTLTSETVEKMLSMNESIIGAYIDSHFDTSKIIEDKLAEIFDEAGEILSDSNSVLKSLRATTAKNASILAGFSRGATENYLDGIDFVSTDGTYTSAVSINKDDGIFIGANKGVSIFAGNAGEGAATVDLNKDHLLLGVLGGIEGTAAEFTKEYIIMAASNTLGYTDWKKQKSYSVGTLVKYGDKIYICTTGHVSSNDWDQYKWSEYKVTGLEAGLVGFKLTKESIGLATNSNNTINAILMNDKGVTIGSGVDINDTTNNLRNTSGSYVRVAPTGIDLGSTADLYINTNNFKLQTNTEIDENDNVIKESIFAIGTDLQSIDENTTITNGKFYNNNIEIKENNVSPSVNFLVNKYGAYINGTVYASAGSFTGDVLAHSFTADGNTNKFIADSTHLGFYSLSNNVYSPIMTLSGSAMTIAQNYTLDIDGNLDINSTNFKIKSNATNGETCFQAGSSSGDYIKYVTSSTNNGQSVPAALIIKGDITATSLHIVENGTEQEATTWFNAKVTPEQIWLGVKSATANTGLKLEDNKITISSSSNGQLIVNTSNVVIDTTATGDNAIFRIGGTGENYKLLYTPNAGLKVKGEITASGGNIGGWIIDSNRLYSGSSSNYVALDSGTTTTINNTTVTEPYALWCGNSNSSSAPFRVKRNGGVYLNSLMVLDKKNGNNWGLGGTDNDHEGIYTVTEGPEDEQGTYGYKAIDFSKLNFKQAVSVTGNWNSAGQFNVKVSLWGILNRTTTMSASVSVVSVEEGQITGSDTALGNVNLKYSINGQEIDTRATGVMLSCPLIYKNGLDTGYTNATADSIELTSRMGKYGLITITQKDEETQILQCDLSDMYDDGYNAGYTAGRNSVTSGTVSNKNSTQTGGNSYVVQLTIKLDNGNYIFPSVTVP